MITRHCPWPLAPGASLLRTRSATNAARRARLAHLVQTGEYSLRIDWLYLLLAVGIALLSRRRQRRSFYFAGLLNGGIALFLIADHREWFDQPRWAMAVVASGLATLLAGYLVDRRRRVRAHHV
jgi:hypothetical protein